MKPAGDEAIGYKALMLLKHGSGKFPVHAAIERHVYAKRKGAGKAEEIGELLYNRGLVGAMLGVEGIRKAQDRFGKKPLTGEQVRWGLPATDRTVAELASGGVRNLAVITPGFSADCLETLEEIAVENAQIFRQNGGRNFAALACLNDGVPGMQVIRQLAARELAGWI